MAVRYSAHVLTRLEARGTNELEIEQALRFGFPDVARPPKLSRAIVFPFGRIWGGRRYEQKKVRVIYVRDDQDELVVTVYVYYGSWEP